MSPAPAINWRPSTNATALGLLCRTEPNNLPVPHFALIDSAGDVSTPTGLIESTFCARMNVLALMLASATIVDGSCHTNGFEATFVVVTQENTLTDQPAVESSQTCRFIVDVVRNCNTLPPTTTTTKVTTTTTTKVTTATTTKATTKATTKTPPTTKVTTKAPATTTKNGGWWHKREVEEPVDDEGFPCRFRATLAECQPDNECLGVLSSCRCIWDDPATPAGAGQDSTCTSPFCCFNAPCSASNGAGADTCFRAGGGTLYPNMTIETPSNCIYGDDDSCSCREPLTDVMTDFDAPEIYAPFDCQCRYVTNEFWLTHGGVGMCVPASEVVVAQTALALAVAFEKIVIDEYLTQCKPCNISITDKYIGAKAARKACEIVRMGIALLKAPVIVKYTTSPVGCVIFTDSKFACNTVYSGIVNEPNVQVDISNNDIVDVPTQKVAKAAASAAVASLSAFVVGLVALLL